MRTPSKILMASAAAALLGSAAVAATLPAVHHLTIRLPNGGTEQISYTGNVAPKIAFLPDMLASGDSMPGKMFGPTFVGLDPISAQMDRMAAAMDHEIAAAIQQADLAMPFSDPGNLAQATLNTIPAGSESYSFVSMRAGNNVCTREVQITRQADGKPKVLSHSSGNCDNANAPGAAAIYQAAPSDRMPVVKAKASLPLYTGAPRQHV